MAMQLSSTWQQCVLSAGPVSLWFQLTCRSPAGVCFHKASSSGLWNWRQGWVASSLCVCQWPIQSWGFSHHIKKNKGMPVGLHNIYGFSISMAIHHVTLHRHATYKLMSKLRRTYHAIMFWLVYTKGKLTQVWVSVSNLQKKFSFCFKPFKIFYHPPHRLCILTLLEMVGYM